ncbi:MAG: hypothetical protein JO197_10045 [Acidobacteria bacterium]|nr:hypothetical protein [Acidobacteriota bacterium]MBV9477434.1 hypothetical protein [Acidobacteriota bacterium]
MNRKPFLRLSLALAATAALALPALASPDALGLVPPNAASVGMVKLRDMRSSPLSSMLFQQTDKMSTDGEAEKFLTDAGLAPSKDIDVLVVSTTPRTNLGSDADVLVAAEGRFNAQRLTSALLSRGAVKKGAYLLLPDDHDGDASDSGAVAFPSSSLVLAGNERAVAAALAAYANGGSGFRSAGALAMDLNRIDRNATAWALVDVARASRLAKTNATPTGHGPQGAALASALKSLSTMAVWATDTGDALQLGAIGLSSDGETLQLIEDTVRGALSALRLAAQDKAPEMVTVLRRFDVTRKDDSIRIEGSIPASTLRDVMAKKHASVSTGTN